jgi:hypothetical protein
VQLVQPGRDNIHHHALNDAPPAQLSAVAVLIVNSTARPECQIPDLPCQA